MNNYQLRLLYGKKTMRTHVAFLRGINVGGKNKIKMTELRVLLEEKADLVNAETYIQSGNIVFQSTIDDKEIIGSKIAQVIKNSYDFTVPVLLLSSDEFKNVFNENNFVLAGDYDISHLHVTLCSKQPPADTLDVLRSYAFSGEEIQVVGSSIYLMVPNGYGKTKLSNSFIENKFKVQATTRNWKTITKIHAMITDKETDN